MPTWRTINGAHVDIDKLSTEEQIRYFGSVEAFETYRTNTKMNEAIRAAAKPKKVSEKDILVDGSFPTTISYGKKGTIKLGDQITSVKTFAGLGTSKPLIDEPRLNAFYNQKGGWKKQAGQVRVRLKINGLVSKRICDVHWYYHKNTGVREMKIKSTIKKRGKPE